MPLTLQDVIAKFPAEVRERYDFSQARYEHALAPMTGIICREHGPFKQYSAQLRKNGAGCPKCGDVIRRAKRRTPQEEMIAKLTEAHDGFYSYDKSVYRNLITKMTVTCPNHGDFDTTPANHLKGRGCPICGAAKRGKRKDPKAAARKTADAKLERSAAEFEQAARAVHGDTYDYSSVKYAGRRKKVTIICPNHGPFDQTPGHHLSRAHGCPECSHHRSKGEAAIAKFMSIFARIEERNRQAIAPKELDIYAPDVGVAVEYCGEYWHAASSVDEERKDRTRHLEKHKACENAGIRLLTIYESEWNARPNVIKRLIRNTLGKGRGRLMARKCDLREVPAGEAQTFFEAYHPQGGNGYGMHYGLYHGDKLVACMRFAFGTNDRGANQNRMWTLTRYATKVSVVGGASRLFNAFVEEHKPESVKSFSDNRYFTGRMYEKLGFVLEENTEPDYQVYHPKTGLLPKTAWQRRNIPARIRDIGVYDSFDPERDQRSERDMTYLLGAQRLFDCGKKRWVWRCP